MTRLFPCMLAVLALALVVGAPAIAQEEKAEEMTAVGKIKSVNAEKNEFVLTDKNGKDWTFQAKDAKVQLAGKAATLKDLRPGTEVTIKYEKQGTKLIAKQIQTKGAGGADK